MISIVIPVHNATDQLDRLLRSLWATTDDTFKLHLIDDASETHTRKYLKTLEGTPGVMITRNDAQQWVNYNWNLGVSKARGKYIAVLNSDIILSLSWDSHLKAVLETNTVACPHTLKSVGGYSFRQAIDPRISSIDSKMIQGACFMFKKSDRKYLFPIPSQLKHWCGDNWIADRANERMGVGFSLDATIIHDVSASGKTVDRSVYKERVLKDLEEYEKLSGRDMSPIRNTL
jgi:glycosyltransferase involved in cell wall biosynthesis